MADLKQMSISCAPCWGSPEMDTQGGLDIATLKYCLLNAEIASDQIIHQNSSRYEELNFQWNTIHGVILPLAYLLVRTVQDVQSAVRCCKHLRVRPVPRSGGHSFAKFGYGDSNSLIIDLQLLNSVTIDQRSRSAWVEAGARVGLIFSTLWNDGFTTPLGMHPGVGISGLSLNGGYSYFARLYGMTCDSILELEMVDHNGDLLIANERKNPDLYWALRGGGAGSFGIVTRLKFKLFTAPKRIIYGRYFYELASFEQFFCAWQNLITSPATPVTLNTFTRIRNNPNVIRLELFNILNEQDFTSCPISVMGKLLAAFPKPINGFIEELPYENFLVKIIGHGAGYPNVTKPSDLEHATKYEFVSRTTLTSFYVEKLIEEGDIRRLNGLIEKFITMNNIFIEHFGGAINNLRPNDTAFVHRAGKLYNMALLAVNANGNEADINEGERLLCEFFEETKAIFHHTESYQNYPDEGSADFLHRYYGSNLKRLVDVKNQIDPENLFWHPQSIPTAIQ